jgi:hypothetical protein
VSRAATDSSETLQRATEAISSRILITFFNYIALKLRVVLTAPAHFLPLTSRSKQLFSTSASSSVTLVRKDSNSSVSDSISSECCCRVCQRHFSICSCSTSVGKQHKLWLSVSAWITSRIQSLLLNHFPKLFVVLPGPSGTFCFLQHDLFKLVNSHCIPASSIHKPGSVFSISICEL